MGMVSGRMAVVRPPRRDRSPRHDLARPPLRPRVLLAAIVAGLVLAVGARAPVFLSAESLNGVLTDTAILAMMALAQMVVILTRGIDLSVAANLALSGMVVALLSTSRAGPADPRHHPGRDGRRRGARRSSTARSSPLSASRRSS